jgi:hypothetical protein
MTIIETIYKDIDLDADDRYITRFGYWIRPVEKVWAYAVFIYDRIDNCYVNRDGDLLRDDFVFSADEVPDSIRAVAAFKSNALDYVKNSEALSKLNKHCRSDRACYIAEFTRYVV